MGESMEGSWSFYKKGFTIVVFHKRKGVVGIHTPFELNFASFNKEYVKQFEPIWKTKDTKKILAFMLLYGDD